MKILVDCDETLLENTLMLKKFYLETIDKNAEINGNQYCSKWKVWDGSDEWVDFITDYAKSDYFKNIPAVKGAVEAIKKLKDAGHSLSIITSAGQDEKVKKNRKENLSKLFGEGIFDEFIFCQLGWGNKKKAMQDFGADMLIDDCIHNCRDALHCGMTPVLFTHPTNVKLVNKIKNGETFLTSRVGGTWQEDNFDELKNNAIITDSWNDTLEKLAKVG